MFHTNHYEYPYPSRRHVLFARKGMVCTSQALAAEAGLDVLKKGGNAIDAAIATAICLTVLEPTSNGIGSDAFALVWIAGEGLKGLNSSGPSPRLLDPEQVRAAYGDKMPERGWIPVTVPGAPAAWAELSRKYGKLEFEALFEAAIRYAEEGFPLSVTTAQMWSAAAEKYRKTLKEAHFQAWFDTFTPRGEAPRAGEIVRLPDHAKTLLELAQSRCESFYRGRLAELTDWFSANSGGWLRGEDLASFRPEWVQPIETNYRGYTVSEIPPNGHGIVALMALNILSGFDLKQSESGERCHRQIEAMKLAFADGLFHLADPREMNVSTDQLLSLEYAAVRRRLIGEKALFPEHGDPASGGTVYLCTADGEGNMVSYIQSNYMGFGSGLVVPGTGIALQNRGANFSLDPHSPNCAAPGKKPYHTIIPGFLSKDKNAVGPFGVMGGFMQPQGHVQVLSNLLDFGMNPQQALDAPRWQWTGGRHVQLEKQFPAALRDELIRRGHEVEVLESSLSMGRGQIILRDGDGVLCGATESRADGAAAVW